MLAAVDGDAVCLVPLRYGVSDLLFGSLHGSFVGSALPSGSGSVGMRSEEAANSLAATLSFDISHMFGCGALSSQSTGHVCHVYVAPAVDGWTPPSSIAFISAKEIHDTLAFEVCGVIAKTTSRSGYGHEQEHLSIGSWHGARRVVANPSGRKYATAVASSTANDEWATCLQLDAVICDGLRRSLERSTSTVQHRYGIWQSR
jgi:hypothetical protein